MTTEELKSTHPRTAAAIATIAECGECEVDDAYSFPAYVNFDAVEAELPAGELAMLEFVQDPPEGTPAGDFISACSEGDYSEVAL